MSRQTAFAVPKDRQDVTVRLIGGAVLEGAIFLEYGPVEHTAYQKVGSFLEDGNSFFPLLAAGAASPEFINKKNICTVEFSYQPEQEQDSLALSLMHAVDITAIFIDESSVSGALLAEVPVEKARLSDCLNLPGRFLSVKIDGKICYVNKGALRKVLYAEKA